MNRRTLAALILGCWLFLVGWQIRRDVFQPELARLAEAAVTLGPAVHFYSVQMGGRAVGEATSRLDTLPDGFVLEDRLSLSLPALGQTGRAVVETRVELNASLVLRSFDFSLDSDAGRYVANGRLVGDTLLEIHLDAGGGVQTLTHRLDEPPVLAPVLPVRLAVGGDLAPGSRFSVPVFDPSLLTTRDVTVEVLAHDTLALPDSAAFDRPSGRWRAAGEDPVPAWHVAQTVGGVRIESWIDEDGRVLRSDSPLGFSLERTEYELARQAFEEDEGSRGGGGDVLLTTAIRSSARPEDVEDRDEVRFVLGGVDLTGFDLDGGRQELRGDTLIVRKERVASLDPGFGLPYPTMDLADHLRSEPLVQSDDQRIVQRARSATSALRSRRNPVRVAARLTDHVDRALDKSITFSVPSAVQVLEAGAGDCNEHTVLYVALARSLGLPARTAVGLAWVDGAFYYHAWPEVWLGEWVAVDPTFGQFPADAGHLRFMTGGLAQQLDIVRLIGRLDIEVVS